MAVLNPEERRGSRRLEPHQIPHVTAVKVASEAVDVINASSSGLLVEGAFPVRPGMSSYVDIIEAAGTSVRVTGSVVRCQISALGPHRPRYRFAIAFERAVPLIEAGDVAAGAQDGFAIGGADVREDPTQMLNNW